MIMLQVAPLSPGDSPVYCACPATKSDDGQWTASTRYPVPDQWLSFRSRSSILTGRKPKNIKASHPINAMLNYAYAVKAAQLRIQAVADGFDPYAGIMRHTRPDFPA